MATKRVTLDATLFPVVVAFEARPGDQIMVVHGVCIGLAPMSPSQTREGEEERAPVPPTNPSPSPIPTREGEAVIVFAKRGKKLVQRDKHYLTRRPMDVTAENILLAIQTSAKGYLTTMEISDTLGLKREAKNPRAHVGVIVRKLLKAQQIQVRPSTRIQMFEYEISPGSPTEVEAANHEA